MEESKAKESLKQLRAYTVDVSKFLGIVPIQNKKNFYVYPDGEPTGAITHYTASNIAITDRRPYGRIPVLLNRFAPGSSQRVGVHFIVWDERVKRFDEMRKRYPLVEEIPGEVFFMGDDKAFWHAGWFNRHSYGIEIRNIGQLKKKSNGKFFWNKGIKYIGRDPIKIGRSHWEPYTYQQMAATLSVHRIMCSIHNIRPERFLGHVHVSSTRIDPGPHFPLHEMREYSLNPILADVPIKEVPWLAEYTDDPGILDRIDIPYEWKGMSERALNLGLYRRDWDGTEDEQSVADPSGELVSDLEDAWEMLRTLGYFVGESPSSSEMREAIRIFQLRWKRRRGRKWAQEVPATGYLNRATKDKILLMVRQQYLL